MQRVTRQTKKYTIDGTAMIDVELVAIMEQALKDHSSKNRYVVKVDNDRWDPKHKTEWANHIRTIDHWNPLDYRYLPRSDTFVFFRKKNKTRFGQPH